MEEKFIKISAWKFVFESENLEKAVQVSLLLMCFFALDFPSLSTQSHKEMFG